MITTLSKKIAYFLVSASNTEPESDQIEVYIYGLECFLNTVFTILILFVWGLLTNTLLETSCWIAAFSGSGGTFEADGPGGPLLLDEADGRRRKLR